MANPANSTAAILPDGRQSVQVTEAKTLAITDSGIVQNVAYASAVITLPATATDGVYIIRNAGVAEGGSAGSGDDGNQISISPNASDNIAGGVTGTATDNKDLINTAATARVGDEMTVKLGLAGGPIITSYSGVWARET